MKMKNQKKTVTINNVDVDVSNPEKMYWNYVKYIPEIHERRGKDLSPKKMGVLNNLILGQKILDVCGGTGLWAKYLVDDGYTVKLIDLSPEMIEIAEEKGLNCEIQDARNIQEEDNSYDSTICLGNSIGGLLSKSDRMKMIKEMVRVSKKYVIIDCNNRITPSHILKWIPIYWKKLIGRYQAGLNLDQNVVSGHNLGDIVWYDPDSSQYLYHYVYSIWELRKEMKSAGLRVKIHPHWWDKSPILIGIIR
jgi:ubiquinone/menaquinone biosynthesis C-methylase UbiE